MKPYNRKNMISDYIQEHKLRKHWYRITTVLAAIAVVVTDRKSVV